MPMTNTDWIAHCLGFLSLLGCLLIFCPVIAIVFDNKRSDRQMFLKLAKWGAIITVAAGLSHGLLTTQQDNIDFYDLKTYWTYAEGLLTFNLLIYLVLSFNEIKLNFKRYIYFIYALLFFVVAHLSETLVY